MYYSMAATVILILVFVNQLQSAISRPETTKRRWGWVATTSSASFDRRLRRLCQHDKEVTVVVDQPTSRDKHPSIVSPTTSAGAPEQPNRWREGQVGGDLGVAGTGYIKIDSSSPTAAAAAATTTSSSTTTPPPTTTTAGSSIGSAVSDNPTRKAETRSVVVSPLLPSTPYRPHSAGSASSSLSEAADDEDVDVDQDDAEEVELVLRRSDDAVGGATSFGLSLVDRGWGVFVVRVAPTHFCD
jgi:hypothetical protein